MDVVPNTGRAIVAGLHLSGGQVLAKPFFKSTCFPARLNLESGTYHFLPGAIPN